jgi:hypothetical protein
LNNARKRHNPYGLCLFFQEQRGTKQPAAPRTVFSFDKNHVLFYSTDMSNSAPETYYRITYREPKDGQILTLKARRVADSSLGLSFIALSDFMFDTESLVVNPTEEDLKKHFTNVKTLHLSIYTVLSIEEVGAEHKGLAFEKDKSNLVVFPTTPRPPKS